MGLLTFAINVTLDGCCDHRVGIADEPLHRYYTGLMDEAGMLFGRVVYEMMESAWPAVARDPKARPAFRTWARKLEAKPKYVVSSTRRDFPWNNTFRVDGDDLRQAIVALKRRTPRGLLVGSPTLSAALERMGLIDEYRIAVHPILAGHGPTLFSGLDAPSRMKLVDTKRFKSGVMALHYRRR